MAFDRIEACFHAVVVTCRGSFSTVSLNSAASFVLPAVKYTDSRPAVGASNYPGLISSAVLFVDFPDRLCLLLPISVVRAVVHAVAVQSLLCEIDYLVYLILYVVRSCPVWSGPVWAGLAWSDPVRSSLVWSVWSGPVRSGPVWTGLVRSSPVRSSPVWSGLDWSDPVRSGPVRSGPIWSGLVCTGMVWSSCHLWEKLQV